MVVRARPGADLDPLAILAALGVRDVRETARIAEGEDTALWRVAHGEQTSALRVMRAEQAVAATYEAAAMRAAHAAGLPVPEIRRQGQWQGRPVFLLEWLKGYTAASAFAVRPWRAQALGLRLGRMQARIHAVSAPESLALRAGRWLSFIEAEEPALCAHLRALGPRTDALLHLDFHPLNALVGNDDAQPFDSLQASVSGRRIIGVIDWTNAAAGDPRADYAYSMTLLHVTRGMLGLPPRRERAALLALARGWERGYRAMAGPLPDLAPFYAWAGAYILRDVAPRLGQAGSVVTAAHLARLRRWTAMWKRRGGIA